jgi:hypothetical protein
MCHSENRNSKRCGTGFCEHVTPEYGKFNIMFVSYVSSIGLTCLLLGSGVKCLLAWDSPCATVQVFAAVSSS